VVISPGSRSAPLTLAFVRHPHIRTYLIPDERAAAFIALGMAQQSNEAVALICTSGSAAYNYAPAIAEAFFEHTPLIVLTADRPPEWIDQRDGQTIRQTEIYGKHVKYSTQLPVSYEHPDAHWHIRRATGEAITHAMTFPEGPVHLNIPFREPFYPEAEQQFWSGSAPRVPQVVKSDPVLPQNIWTELRKIWSRSPSKLIIAGQGRKEKLPFPENIPVVADIISNQFGEKNRVHHQDLFLGRVKHPGHFQPDLLITFGRSVISKNLKIFLRNNRPEWHWHIQEAGEVADTFQSLTHIIRTTPKLFFEGLIQEEFPSESDYPQHWQTADETVAKYLHYFWSDEKPFSEFEAVKYILKGLPENSTLHLANSMAVRYANFFNLPENPSVEVFANRGTSGIDGCLSTAVGHAITDPNRLHTLLIGDMAFFYDRNALWHNHLPNNLRIVLLNNQGGGIFRMIKGPRRQPELTPYFTTPHDLNAEAMAKEVGFEYAQSSERRPTQQLLTEFWKASERSKILEIKTDQETNTAILEEFRQVLNQSLK
ncbi:MAG: 2-succinyl-5-enolpyruvyl-6-hydroxy-3-cyclohexene-1-carboxylic-acid synthase, partial [Bacteroidota bacterium]